MPLAALHTFNTGATPDTSSATHFRQAYLELHTAAYNAANRLRPAYLRDRADFLARRDSVPLAVFDAAFHLLDTLAVADNLLTEQNGLLYDVAGRPRAPFVARTLVLAAALADTVAPATRFYFSPQLALSTRGRVVSRLLIDFDDQHGPVQCLPGQVLPVSYGSPGAKVLRFTVFFADGTQAPALARLYVRAGALSKQSLPLTGSIADVTATRGFTDYAYSITGPFLTPSRLSLYGMGQTLTVLHHRTSQDENSAAAGSYKLRNPIIFIDGFDANDKRKLFLNNGATKSIYNDLRDQGILDLFDRQERDLIILNFPKSPRPKVGGGWTGFDVDGGTDYIERNALVLVQLLNDLRPRLAGPAEKFTIIGPSMADLISRYALARMEKEKLAATTPTEAAYWDHNTALWISLDSPHQGANIPLGDFGHRPTTATTGKYMMQYFAPSSPSTASFLPSVPWAFSTRI